MPDKKSKLYGVQTPNKEILQETVTAWEDDCIAWFKDMDIDHTFPRWESVLRLIDDTYSDTDLRIDLEVLGYEVVPVRAIPA